MAEGRYDGETGRLEAFTDGVFAIAITLLVLEVQIPDDLPDKALPTAIADIGPSLTAWVISFLITGMYWVWHRDVFAQVQVATRELLWLNLLFLLPVSLIPFAASVLGRYDREPTALRLYGAVLILVSLTRLAIVAYLAHRPALLATPVSAEGRRSAYLLTVFPIVVYGLAMGLAGIVPTLSLLLFLAMPALYFVSVALLRARPDAGELTELA